MKDVKEMQFHAYFKKNRSVNEVYKGKTGHESHSYSINNTKEE